MRTKRINYGFREVAFTKQPDGKWKKDMVMGIPADVG
jgi:hypothetical protein